MHSLIISCELSGRVLTGRIQLLHACSLLRGFSGESNFQRGRFLKINSIRAYISPVFSGFQSRPPSFHPTPSLWYGHWCAQWLETCKELCCKPHVLVSKLYTCWELWWHRTLKDLVCHWHNMLRVQMFPGINFWDNFNEWLMASSVLGRAHYVCHIQHSPTCMSGFFAPRSHG